MLKDSDHFVILGSYFRCPFYHIARLIVLLSEDVGLIVGHKLRCCGGLVLVSVEGIEHSHYFT